MQLYSPEYLGNIKSCWEKYVQKDIPLKGDSEKIRKDIYDSWKRSKQYGVRIDTPLEAALNDVDFSQILKLNSDLIRVAYPYIQNLYNFIKGTNYLIHLSDKNGCILKYMADDTLIQHLMTDVSNLKEGSVRNEQLTGTDSTSLCLAIDKPVQVLGEEHYRSENHAFFCSSAPIHNDSGLIGILTIMGPRELYQNHTLGMACAAVDGIEKEMRMQKAYNDLSLTNNILTSTINALGSGVIILNASRKVVQYNTNALKNLKFPPDEQLKGKHIYTILDANSLPESIQKLNADADGLQFTAITGVGLPVDISLTVTTIYNDEHQLKNIVLIIDEQKQIHQLVNKVSGFTASYTFESIIGESQAVKNMKHMGMQAARSTSNVLILGESGTGKELLAQAIHNASPRDRGPFIAVNCGSIPKNLIESELFGYESGAFTGAKKEGHPGKFELANGGTLFLDEIGDMPLELQISLLRVLQSHEVTRLGGKYAKKIDVKVIAATNVDLLDAVRQKNFRSDLYYRLNVLNIYVPPLRERTDDILLLANAFIESYKHSMRKQVAGLSSEVKEIFLRYDWPGNIRELENIIERGINLIQGNTLTINDLPVDLVRSASPNPSQQSNSLTAAYEALSPQIKERNAIISALEREKGHIKSVALSLDMPTSTLYRKLRKYNINAKDYKRWDSE